MVNSEPAMTLAEGCRFAETKKPWRFHIAAINTLLGFRRRKHLRRPAISHPIDNLIILNGAIFQVRGEQLGGEYLALSGIEIVRKLSLKELDDERCEYRFELSGGTDGVWRLLFKAALARPTVRFERNVLVLTCLPVNLELNYEQVRGAVQQANALYAEERESLIPRVIARDEERNAAREMAENRKTGLRRQFECLEL